MNCPKCGFVLEQEQQICPNCKAILPTAKYKKWHRAAAVLGIAAVVFLNIWLLLKIAGRV